jgi:Xaa-Pro dipeptidase
MPKLSPALTFGPTIADWQERINVERLRRERAERMRAVMRQHGIPALLASGAPNCRYLVGLRGAEFNPQLWYVLFFAESEPIVFAHAGYITQLPREAPWVRDYRLARSWLSGICGPEAASAEAARFAAEIVAALGERGLAHEPLAVIGIDDLGQRALRDQGVDVRGGWSLMLEATKTKTIDEINCTKLAVQIAEVALYRFVEELRPGINEAELLTHVTAAALAAGAEEVRVGVRSGPLCFERGMKDTARFIRHGELLYGQTCGTSYLGYRTCLYRTFLVGREPTPQEADWYKRLLDRVDAVIDAIRPGATTADAARHFAPASTWGYADEAYVLTMEVGHGVGLHQYQMPTINRQWSLDHPQVFEPGMLIAVESREGEPWEGGVRLEDLVVVTEHGAELLDAFPRDRILAVPFC